MSETKHSPLPWKVRHVKGKNEDYLFLEDANGDLIGVSFNLCADIPRIALACNHFEEGTKLLRKAVDKLSRQDIYEELQEGIWEYLDKLESPMMLLDKIEEADHE